MTQRDEATRDAILARLAQSRAEIGALLEPPPAGASGDGAASHAADGEFPRSRTMRMLTSGRGLGAVGAVVGGLLIARPALAWRLVRLLPTSAVARMVVLRAITAIREKHDAVRARQE